MGFVLKFLYVLIDKKLFLQESYLLRGERVRVAHERGADEQAVGARVQHGVRRRRLRVRAAPVHLQPNNPI